MTTPQPNSTRPDRVAAGAPAAGSTTRRRPHSSVVIGTQKEVSGHLQLFASSFFRPSPTCRANYRPTAKLQRRLGLVGTRSGNLCRPREGIDWLWPVHKMRMARVALALGQWAGEGKHSHSPVDQAVGVLAGSTSGGFAGRMWGKSLPFEGFEALLSHEDGSVNPSNLDSTGYLC